MTNMPQRTGKASAPLAKRMPGSRGPWWAAALALAMAAATTSHAQFQVRTPPADARAVAAQMQPMWEELVTLVKARPWSGPQWARGTYLGARILAIGSGGVPFVGSRFSRTDCPEEAFLAGVFMATCGGESERWFIRRELESNPVKRRWLTAMCGSGQALSHAFSEGRDWEAAARLLPSPSGCRALTRDCMASNDPLVRRAGMLWGFWLADEGYWSALREAAKKDSDELTRRFAHFLAQRAT